MLHVPLCAPFDKLRERLLDYLRVHLRHKLRERLLDYLRGRLLNKLKEHLRLTAVAEPVEATGLPYSV